MTSDSQSKTCCLTRFLHWPAAARVVSLFGSGALLLFGAAPAGRAALSAAPNQNGASLVQTLCSADVAVSNVVLVSSSNGSKVASGTFSGGTDAGTASIGIASGVILDTGGVEDAHGPNSTTEISTGFGTPGDADLAAAIPNTYNDACSLQFDFNAVGTKLRVRYVLASDEYEEYISYADAFAFLVKDLTAGAGSYHNVALLPGSATPVSIGTVNQTQNTGYYRRNTSGTYDTEYDGMTTVLTAQDTLIPGHTYRFKMVIADKGDSSVDSAVFLEAGSFSSVSQVLPGATRGQAYNAQVNGTTTVPTPNSFTVDPSSSLPPGISLDGTSGALSGTPTVAGNYGIVINLSDGADSDQVTVFLAVAKTPATVNLSGLSQTYDGTAKTAGATTEPTGLTVNFTYNGSATAPTAAGNYTVIGTIADANYTGSATNTMTITKAPASVTLTGLSQTYDGTAKHAGATTSPSSLSVSFT